MSTTLDRHSLRQNTKYPSLYYLSFSFRFTRSEVYFRRMSTCLFCSVFHLKICEVCAFNFQINKSCITVRLHGDNILDNNHRINSGYCPFLLRSDSYSFGDIVICNYHYFTKSGVKAYHAAQIPTQSAQT